MDGEPRGEPSRDGVFALRAVDRGTHRIEVQVVDRGSGEVLASSASVSFHLLRHSRLHPP